MYQVQDSKEGIHHSTWSEALHEGLGNDVESGYALLHQAWEGPSKLEDHKGLVMGWSPIRDILLSLWSQAWCAYCHGTFLVDGGEAGRGVEEWMHRHWLKCPQRVEEELKRYYA